MGLIGLHRPLHTGKHDSLRWSHQQRWQSNVRLEPADQFHPSYGQRKRLMRYSALLAVMYTARRIYDSLCDIDHESAHIESLTCTILEQASETKAFTRVKVSMEFDENDKQILRQLQTLFTVGHIRVTESKTEKTADGFVVGWEVEKDSAKCTLLLKNTKDFLLSPKSDIQVSPRRESRSVDYSSSVQSLGLFARLAGWLASFLDRNNNLSFLGLPNRVDRLIMVSRAEDIPKLYTIFGRCTGYAACGTADHTLRAGKDSRLHRIPLLWIIEADGPEDIALLKELQHVAKGSHFFDFYVTTPKPCWGWPSGIGPITESLMRDMVPAEITDGIGNSFKLPLAAQRYSTGFILSGSDAFLERLMGPKTGALASHLPEGFDTKNSVRVIT